MMSRVLVIAQRYPIWIAVVLLYALASIVTPAMLSPDQVSNIIRVTAFLGMVAAGQTIVLLMGGIDLSVAGGVTLTNILCANVMMGPMKASWRPWPCVWLLPWLSASSTVFSSPIFASRQSLPRWR